MNRTACRAAKGLIWFAAAWGISTAVAEPAAAAPENDNVAAATPLVLDERQFGTNEEATREPNEPKHVPGATGGRSVWFKWTNGSQAAVTVVDLEGTRFDSVLAIYNAQVSEASRTRFIDIGLDDAVEHTHFNAIANSTYYIVVDGATADEMGQVGIRVSQSAPENDDFDNARLIDARAAQDVHAGMSTRLATSEPGEPRHAGSAPYKTVWFSFVAPRAGKMVAAACGSSDDTVLGVYRGTSFANLVEVGSNDQSPTGCRGDEDNAYTGFDVLAAREYSIAVGVFDDADAPASGGTEILHLFYDESAPVARFVSGTGPSALTRQTTARFLFEAVVPAEEDDLDHFECALDAAAFGTCASPFELRNLGDGQHRLRLRAVDAAGNAGEVVEHVWTVDTTPPDTRITSAPSGIVPDATATFAFDAEPGASYACKLDLRPAVPCASPARYDGLRNGRHRFKVWATDALGNEDPTPATVEWTVSIPPPPPPTVTGATSVQFKGVSGRTLLVRFLLLGVERGTRVVLLCRGRSCPFRSVRLIAGRAGTIDVTRRFRRRPLRPGTRLEVRLTRQGAIGRRIRHIVRKESVTDAMVDCLPPRRRPVVCSR